jgi:glycosyltransferase involved in cell wall biosynthesis
VVCPVSAAVRWKRYAYEQLRFPKLLKNYNLDIIHSLGYVSPLRTPCPAIVTIHDLNYRVLKNRMPLVRRIALATLVGQSIKRCDRIITISEFSRRLILKTFNIESSRVAMVYPAPKHLDAKETDETSSDRFLNEMGITPPYFISFGNRGANKNMHRLLEAFVQAIKERKIPHQLVLVGHLASEFFPKKTILNNSAVKITGYLDDYSLQVVLSRAQAMIAPSLYEGFGCPVLEAMAAGVPVLCSNVASFPEVVGDAAVFFDPYSIEDMKNAIESVATDSSLRTRLRERGYVNLGRFSWEITAKKVMRIYQDMINNASRADRD